VLSKRKNKVEKRGASSSGVEGTREHRFEGTKNDERKSGTIYNATCGPDS
jgi:hypothetical protein